MADEAQVAAPVSTPAPESAPVVAPVSEAPASAPEVVVVAPVVESTASGSPTETPVAEVPVAEAKPLLNPETPEVKTEAPKETAEAPKVETPLPVYEFKLPEGAKTDNPIFKSFQSKLGEFQNLSKAEQVAVNKFGQEMIDLHLEDVKSIVENSNKAAWDWFKNRNSEWLESAKKDPGIGGDKWDATVSEASQAIKLYGGTKAQQIETAKLLQETGVENHPAILRFLSNITRIAAKEGQPVSGGNTPMQKPNIAQAMYGGTKAS